MPVSSQDLKLNGSYTAEGREAGKEHVYSCITTLEQPLITH